MGGGAAWGVGQHGDGAAWGVGQHGGDGTAYAWAWGVAWPHGAGGGVATWGQGWHGGGTVWEVGGVAAQGGGLGSKRVENIAI